MRIDRHAKGVDLHKYLGSDDNEMTKMNFDAESQLGRRAAVKWPRSSTAARRLCNNTAASHTAGFITGNG
jgi:hypothetical protein